MNQISRAIIIRIEEKSLHDGTPQSKDFTEGTPLLWAQTHDLSRTQAAVKKQVGDPLLAWVRKHRLEDLPDFFTLDAIFDVLLSWLRQRDFSWPRIGPQCIQDDPMQTRAQVLQGCSKLVEF